MGFISQEVQSAITGKKYMEDSRIVQTAVTVRGSETTEKLELAPAHFLTPLIKAVQQLSAKVEEQSVEIELLKAQLEG